MQYQLLQKQQINLNSNERGVISYRNTRDLNLNKGRVYYKTPNRNYVTTKSKLKIKGN